MKKKILGALLAVSMAAGILAGCSNGSKENKTDTTANSTADTASESQAATDQTAKGTAEAAVTEADSGQESNLSGADQSLSYVTEKGTFILGLDTSFPPMGFLDDNMEIVGFDIDVAKEVAKRMGVELVLQPISWSSKELELSSKNIDCIWNGLSVNEERQKNLTLSDNYMSNTQVVVVPADSEITSLADLAGKSVVIQNGSTAQDAVEADQEFMNSLGELTKVEDNIKAMLDMKIQMSDAVVMDKVVAAYYTELDANQGQFKILDESLSEESYAIGFRKGDEALCDEVNQILKEMEADGTLAAISETWFGSNMVEIGN